jgi:hypothetical protein
LLAQGVADALELAALLTKGTSVETEAPQTRIESKASE